MSSTAFEAVKPFLVSDTTDATSTTAASLKTAGGLAVAKSAYIGLLLNVTGGATFQNTLSCGLLLTASSGVLLGDGTYAAGKAYTSAASGLVLTAKTGSANDFVLADASGNAAISMATGTKKLAFADNIVMASGKGIDFSATSDGSGTATSEVLSDYEEGTFTPTVTAASGTITSYTSSGHYVKVGRLVQVQVIVSITNAGTGAGAMNFTVPFASNVGGVSSAGSGIETAAVGFACTCYIGTNSATGIAYRDAFSTPIGTGNSLILSMTFQTA
jgi:hypothetical protein